MVSTQEMIAMALGTNQEEQTTEADTSGISGLDFGFLGKDTTAAQRLERYNRIAQGLYPVLDKEQYQAQAEQLYPQQNYGREKFFADIMLGLGLISGRSEGGRWAPIVEKELGEYLETTAPFADAERQRQAQIGQFVMTEEEEDEEKQREFISTLMAADITKQLSFMETFTTLTKAEAEADGWPVDQGQVYQKSDTTGLITPVIRNVLLRDKWEIMSAAEAKADGLPVDLGQVYMKNEATDEPKLIDGWKVKEGEVVLTEDQALAQGLSMSEGQIWSAEVEYGADGSIASYKNFKELQAPLQMFDILSNEEATAQKPPLPIDKGQIWQVNTRTKEVSALPEAYWRKGFTTITTEQAMDKHGINPDNYAPGTIFQEDRDGQLSVAVTGAQTKERDKKIAYYKDMLMRNDPKMVEQAAHDLAVKYTDNLITLRQDEVGRIFATDLLTKNTEWVNKNLWEQGDKEWQLIGSVAEDDPYVEVMQPPTVDIATMSATNIDDAQRKLTDFEKALTQGQQIYQIMFESVGPMAFLRGGVTNFVAPIAGNSFDKWVAFVKEPRNAAIVELYTRTLIQALALNPRFPVAEQEIISKLGSQEDILAFWTDPKAGVFRFNETMRFLQNNINWERARLNPDKDRPFLFKNPTPTGASTDAIDMQTVDGMKFAFELQNNIPKEMYEELYFITPDGKKGTALDLQIEWKPGE